MSLFRLDASIRQEGSISRAIADIVERTWREENPDATVNRRHVGIDPLPSTTWALAVSANSTPEEDQSEAQREAKRVAATLGDELLDADALLFAVPLYNFGVPQHFKAWVDVVLTDPRLSSAAGKALASRPAVSSSCAAVPTVPVRPATGGTTRPGWIRRILEDVWGLDLKVVETEFTLVGVNPALDAFKDLAHQMRVDAEILAAEHGRHLVAESVSQRS